MREILFRGKRKDNGEWIYGDLVCGNMICNNLIDTEDALGTYYGEIPYVGFVDVIPETVGQFTGLLDKNNNKIFEGDIVRYKYARKFDVVSDIPNLDPENVDEKIRVVKYSKGKFYPMPEINYCDDYWYSYGSVDFEVIGNIHDNPELLEEK